MKAVSKLTICMLGAFAVGWGAGRVDENLTAGLITIVIGFILFFSTSFDLVKKLKKSR